MGNEAMAGTVESQQEGGPREGAQASSMTARIVEAVVRRARSGDPVRVLGLTGPPGTGKTTIATELARALPQAGISVAGLAPMDGFHMSNALLAARGLADHKGAPDTFDVGGYVALLGRVRRANGVVLAPDYRRDLHEPVAASLPIEVDGVVITEGNYLGLELPGWADVRGLIDLLVYIDTPFDELASRLIEFWARSRGCGALGAHGGRGEHGACGAHEGTRRPRFLPLARAPRACEPAPPRLRACTPAPPRPRASTPTPPHPVTQKCRT